MEELWKYIVSYEGMYQVSNLGRVRSLDRIDSRGCKRKGSIMITSINMRGYRRVNLCKNGVRDNREVHRLVAEAFVDNPDNKLIVNHIDGVKTNNVVINLEWCTTLENNNHAIETGLTKTKLSLEDVKEIRKVYIPKHEIYGGKALAKKYGVLPNYISRVVNGKAWKNSYTS